MGLFGGERAARREIDDLADFEREAQQRLTFVELQSRRARRPGAWRRHVTIADGEFEPIGRKTQTMAALSGVDPWRWWVFGGIALAVLVIIAVIAQ